MAVFISRVVISGVTLYVELDREELSSMPGDKKAISMDVIDLGVPGVVVLGFPFGSMFNVLFPI